MAGVTFHRGAPLQLDSTLIIVDPDGNSGPPAQLAEPLGTGASGAVYRAVQDNILSRAVKILDPSDKLLQRHTMQELAQVFEKEKRKLAQLTHSHIAKLISFGLYTRSDPDTPDPLPYLVMEYVEGTRLHDYICGELRNAAKNDSLRAGTIVLDLLDDVLAALQYMHDHHALHADIKEANVLVRVGDRPEATLVDLGCAHIFTPDVGVETTSFNSTRSRNSEKWRRLVGQLVPSEEILRERVSIDLHQFGLMIQVLLKLVDWTQEDGFAWQSRSREVLRWAFPEYGEITLERVAKKCLCEDYRSADAVRKDIAVLSPGWASPYNVAELAMGTGAVTSISLPEGRIPLTPHAHRLVNHPCVERLNNIFQLDFLRLVYPGASHTRFLHSLEAFDFTRHYIAALCGDPVFRAYAADQDSLQAMLVAGLVHDIGHYPLEHIFEDFAAARDRAEPYADVLTDDDVVRAMMSIGPEGHGESIRNAVASSCERAAQCGEETVRSIPDLVGELYGEVTLRRLRAVLSPRRDDIGAKLLHSIIDGPIDVDKVAYLRTDAMMTGAKYGRAIDMDPLLGSLVCYAGGAIEQTDMGPAIGIRLKALCAVESIATSRRWMFQRVYWHRTNRAMMAMLRFPIQYLFDHDSLTFSEYFGATYALTDVEAVRWIDKRFRDKLENTGDLVANPAQCLLEGRRVVYKKVLELGTRDTGRRGHARHYIQRRPCHEWLHMARQIAEVIRLEVPSVRDSDVLLDVPVSDRPTLEDLPVALGGDKWTTMATVSDEYRQTKDFFKAGSMYCRVFVHPRLRAKLAAGRLLQRVEDAILERLV